MVVIQPLSTHLIKPNFCFDLSHGHSTTVSLETRNPVPIVASLGTKLKLLSQITGCTWLLNMYQVLLLLLLLLLLLCRYLMCMQLRDDVNSGRYESGFY